MTQPEVEIRRAWRHVVGLDHDRYVDDLLLRYRQPHRYYHTGTHIMMVIRHVHDVAAMSARQPSVELVAAALYHDAIYDPRATNNEALSGALATEHLGEIGWAEHRCASVRALIEATAGHTATVDDTTRDTTSHETSDTAILLDADLAILGSEAHSYQAYLTGVRAEYFFVDDDRWRAGRGRVLQDFVARPRIFATEYMYTELEHRARANIEAELAALHLSMRLMHHAARDD
jgi:predicted metal-dependent HD superfamily phosphohydrolase